MHYLKFETATRYYIAWLCRDLFGNWCVMRTWGGKGNNLGGMDTLFCESEEEGMVMLEEIRKRRRQRNYREIF